MGKSADFPASSSYWWLLLVALGILSVIIYGYLALNKQLRKAQDRLAQHEKSEAKYRELVENQTDLVIKLDMDGRFLFVNRQFYKLFDKTEQDLIGASYVPFVHLDDRENADQALKKLYHKPHTSFVELRARTRFGWRWLGWMNSAVKNSDGKIIANVCIGRDTTEKKQAETALQKSEALLNEVGKIAKIGGWEIDLIEGTAEWTQGTFDILGLPHDESAPDPNDNLYFYLPEYQPLVQKSMRQLIEEDIPVNFEAQLQRQDGQVVWGRVLGKGIKENGKCVKVFGTFQDITELKMAEKALQESEKTLSVIFNSNSDLQMLVSVEEEGSFRLKTANKALLESARRFIGDISMQDIVGKTLHKVILDIMHFEQKVYDYAIKFYQQAIKTGMMVNYDDYYEFGKTKFYTKNTLVPVLDDGGICQFVLWTAHNVTDSKLAEKALLEEKLFSESLFNSMMDGFSVLDINGVHIAVNPALCKMTGFSEEELVGTGHPHPYWPPDEIENIQKKIESSMSINDFEAIFMRKNGERFPVLISPSFIKDEQGKLIQVHGTIKDITDRKQAEEQIKTSLAEKEILLRELYHRTKNNMQVIHSMMSLQLLTVQDQTLKNILVDIQNKIQSMALVHQKLYQSRNLSSIDLRDYVQELVAYLFSSYNTDAARISLERKIDDVTVLIDIAIPCGMVLSELISNALKHAFPKERKGVISVKIWEDNDIITLIVSDNGVGIPAGMDIYNSLGLQTVRGLVTHQLQGKVEITVNDGVTWQIQFKNQRYHPRV